MKGNPQRGATGLLILVILILFIVGLLASAALNRVTTGAGERNETQRRLAVGADALEQFAATNARLPCPADPTLNDGVEVLAPAMPAKCSILVLEGTIPWKTLGMKYDDAFDAWGRKISYRVYTGTPNNKGSLTQPGGVSMVECDTIEPASKGATNVVASLGGLCRSSTDVTELFPRSTLPIEFLAGKGLSLDDFVTHHDDVAYVLISHGATGLGAYTVSGARLELPAAGGDELKNTQESAGFTIKAFSDPDIAANIVAHFDDLLVYRTLPDLVQRIGLAARDWPEPP